MNLFKHLLGYLILFCHLISFLHLVCDEQLFSKRDAAIEDFPFFVSLEIVRFYPESETLEGSYCGGSLIDTKWVLTAAHCVQHGKDVQVQVYVTVGMDKSWLGGFRVATKGFFFHENFNFSGSMHNDIALVHLENSLDFDDRVWPVELPARQDEETGYNKGQLLGFRMQEDEDGQPGKQLTVIQVEIFKDHDYCFEKQDRYNSTVMFCAGRRKGGEDVCFGDSGGPFVVTRATGSSFLAGIVSFSTVATCGLPDYPSYYVRVSSYLEWIEKTMKQNDKEDDE